MLKAKECVFLITTGFVFALWLSVGCGPKYPNCETDEHCKEHNEYCVDKLCRECKTDEHCVSKKGDACQTCNQVTHTCEKKPGCCHSDLDCPGGKCWKAQGEQVGTCGPMCRSNSDCPEGKECVGGNCVAKQVPCPGGCGPGKQCVNNRCEWLCQPEPIYFDYNEALLRTDARQTLDKNAECLRKLGVKVTIEGNCDERGTTEYNMALGERRAQAAKQYLMDKGIPSSMLSTISYGEEKPVCTESNEDCWWRNRRDDFRLEGD